MKQNPTATKFDRLCGLLRMRGMSLDGWASSEGYNPGTVRTVIRRHFDKQSRFTGIQTQEILSKLNKILASSSEASNAS